MSEIKRLLTNVITKKFGLEWRKCITVTTDGARNMINAFDINTDSEELAPSPATNPLAGRLQCIAHRLNNFVQYLTGRKMTRREIDAAKTTNKKNKNDQNDFFDAESLGTSTAITTLNEASNIELNAGKVTSSTSLDEDSNKQVNADEVDDEAEEGETSKEAKDVFRKDKL